MAQCIAKTSRGTQCKNKAQPGSDFCHIDSHCEEKDNELNPKQEKFCQLYVSKEFFANGTQAYAEAYGIDLSDNYTTAKVNASKLLTNTNICTRIDQLLDEAGLNDNFVDKQLLFLIQQHSEYNSKLGAIKEYNKVRGRITDKIEHSGQIGGRIVINGGEIDLDEWETKAKGYMERMMGIVQDMKDIADT